VALGARKRLDELAKMTKERAAELQQRGQVILEEQKKKLSRKSESKPPEEPAAAA